ncbi:MULTISPECIES: GNAT family N-acetyltransferase [Pseudomonas]|uniref:N-acetyltransferase domain-containing protein n=1 Tax=Pseudomonas fluorescens TaxID=294 RepID=A0A5E6WXX2_PSEFL|nr:MULTISPECIES: GNAT family N-acetyltransferase [Pseudomonas]VVN33057.1 hypothetical protein PS652_04951 [Pseudomonas fluorescens]
MNKNEIDESNFQFLSMWKRLAGDHPGANLADEPGLSMRWADNAFAFWNALYLTEQISDAEHLRTRLTTAQRYMKSKQHDGLVYVCEDYLSASLLEQMETIVDSTGLVFALHLTGMVGNLLPFAEHNLHPALTFKRAENEEILQAYADINSAGYGLPLAAGRAGLMGSDLWRSSAYAYVGYDNGVPVSTSAAIVNDGQLYLALVATLPEAQRKGFGHATVRHALQCAYEATGLTRTSLHATEAGAPVYERIGYHRVTRFRAYMPKP